MYRRAFERHEAGELVRLFEAVATRGELTPHPQYEFGTPEVNADRVVLVGDAAHMASPRTAVGAHTAVLDAVAMREAFTPEAGAGVDDGDGGVDHIDIDRCLERYRLGGISRAQQLLARSQEVSQQFLPPGGVRHVVSPSGGGSDVELPGSETIFQVSGGESQVE
jgi:2-polyprenyl-6-methoxyphenol hydroxylase-like FAD-dependent oxidoreductase